MMASGSVSNKLTVPQHLHVVQCIDIESSVQRPPVLRHPAPQVTTVDEEGKDVEDAQVDLLYQNGDMSQNTMEQRVAPAVVAIT